MRNTLGNPETLPGTDPMSLPCSPTWASVVANGIRGAPKYPASPKLDKSQALPSNAPSNAKPLLSSSWPLPPTTSTSSPSPSPCYKSAISSINPVWNECDTLSSNSRKHKSKKKSKAKAKQESSPSPLPSPLSSPLPLTSPSVLLPDLQQSTKNEETLQTGASVNGSPNGMYYNDNHYQKSQNGYRAHSHPHCPTPMGWRPRRVRSRTSFGSLLESDERYAPDVNWPDMSMLQSQQMDDKPTSVFWTEAENFACGNRYSSNNSSNTSSNYRDNYRGNYTSNYSGNYSSNYSPNYSGNYSGNCSSNYSSNYSPNYNSNYNSDNEHLQSVCMSPRERDRCQVAFVHNACNTDSWEMVGNSRQVWEPILRNQRSQDPSLDMREYTQRLVYYSRLTWSPSFLFLFSLFFPSPFFLCAAPPPPGFENFPLGKTLLSSRSRQLLGEQVSCWQQPEYTTPHPMLQPEQELREQLHFIGKFVLGSLMISLSSALSNTLSDTLCPY